MNGKQYRRSAGTKVWAEAERAKRELEDSLAGTKAPEAAIPTIRDAAKLFIQAKESSGVTVDKFRVELPRFADYCEGRNVFTFSGITLALLIGYRDTWTKHYGSSYTRAFVQKRLGMFLRFAKEAGYLDRVPRLDPIRIDEPQTMPLTDAEFNKLLDFAFATFDNDENRNQVIAVMQLMRWSGLAVRDAVTLSAKQLHEHNGVYVVQKKRQKTGVFVSVPIPRHIGELIKAFRNDEGYFFWTPRTASATARAQKFSVYISRVFDAAGISSEGHMVSHRLRDTFAVDLLTKGVPLEDVSKLLGHSSVTTTEKHYAQWVKGRQDRLTNIVTATWEATQ
jgi:site-specific recombinase XerD